MTIGFTLLILAVDKKEGIRKGWWRCRLMERAGQELKKADKSKWYDLQIAFLWALIISSIHGSNDRRTCHSLIHPKIHSREKFRVHFKSFKMFENKKEQQRANMSLVESDSSLAGRDPSPSPLSSSLFTLSRLNMSLILFEMFIVSMIAITKRSALFWDSRDRKSETGDGKEKGSLTAEKKMLKERRFPLSSSTADLPVSLFLPC